METIEISYFGLGLAFLLLAIPLLINHYFKLKIKNQIFSSVIRMSVQLFLVGFFLEYIFEKNSLWLNLLWLGLMVLTAVLSALSKVKIKFKIVFWPILLAFVIPTFTILLYINAFVVRLDFLFEARYLIALGGMLLGNILSLNIVAFNSFYRELKIQEKFFFSRLAMGATQKEALAPFIRHSFQLTLLPMLAKTATMGIVTLPGMMSGQIIGGSSPSVAIRYQIAIMIAIFTSGALSILLTLLLSIKSSFNKFGVLRNNIFKK
jgi:putative ABC transport system permease protein